LRGQALKLARFADLTPETRSALCGDKDAGRFLWVGKPSKRAVRRRPTRRKLARFARPHARNVAQRSAATRTLAANQRPSLVSISRILGTKKAIRASTWRTHRPVPAPRGARHRDRRSRGGPGRGPRAALGADRGADGTCAARRRSARSIRNSAAGGPRRQGKAAGFIEILAIARSKGLASTTPIWVRGPRSCCADIHAPIPTMMRRRAGTGRTRSTRPGFRKRGKERWRGGR
jgi:hypothetical protein